MKDKLFRFLFTISIATTVCSIEPVKAQQGGQPQVAVVNLKVVKDASGAQSVVTPKGDLAPLPGAGVNGGVAQIYVGSTGGFWYTDKTGKNIDLVPAVHALQAKRAQMQQASQVPQYAPNPNTQQQQPQQQQQQTSGSGKSALGTAAAAGLGVMTGAALSRGYYNAPYGTPMYYGPGGTPYYYNNGERRTVEDLTPNQKAFAYNKYNANQQQKQQRQAGAQNVYNQRQTNIQNRQQSIAQGVNNTQSNRQLGSNNRHFANMQKQQNWYQNQLKQNGNRAQNWQKQSHNPFVSSEHLANRSVKSDAKSRRFGGRLRDKGSSLSERRGHLGGRFKRGSSDSVRSGLRGGLRGRRGR